MNVMDPLQEVSSTMTEENEVFIEIEVGQPHNGISLAEAANALITLQVPAKESSQQLLPVSSSENGKKETEKTESPVVEVNPKDFRRKILEGMKSQFNISTEEDTAITTELSNRRGPPRSKSKFKRGNLDEEDPAEEVVIKIEPSARVPRGRGRPPKSAQLEVPRPLTIDTKINPDGAKPERDWRSEAGSKKSDSATGNSSSGTAVTTRRSQRTNISRTSATKPLKGFTERQISKKRPSSAQDMLKPTDVPRKRGRRARNSVAPVERESSEPLDSFVSNSIVNIHITRIVAEESTSDVDIETIDLPEVKLASCLETSSEQQVSAIEPVVDEVLKVEHMASLGLQSRSNARESSKTEAVKKKIKGQKRIVPSNILGSETVKETLDKDGADSTLDISGSTLEQSSSSEEPSSANTPEQEQEPENDKEQSGSLENEIEVSVVEEQMSKENSSTAVAKKVNGYLNDRREKHTHYSCACTELRQPTAVAPPAAALYCQAVDSVGGKLVGCYLIANRKRFHRPSRKIPFMILCDSHRDRIRKHFCCPGCGLFCTQGTFLQCQGVEGSLHFFHAQCQRPGQKSTCLHCNRDDSISEIQLQMKTWAVPVFCNDAKLLKTMLTVQISLIPRESLESLSSPSSSMSPSPCPNYLASQLVLPPGKVIYSNGIPKSLNRNMLERMLKSLETKTKASASSKNLYSACKNGDIERVIECLRSGQNVNTVYAESVGQTPLHATCHGGHSENATQRLAVTPKNKTKPVPTVTKLSIEVHNQKPREKILKLMPSVPSSTNHVGEPDLLIPEGKEALRPRKQAPNNIKEKTENKTVKMFSWSDAPSDGIEVTTHDYDSLNKGKWLNDTIVDFYLRYILSTKMDRAKFHLFNPFFYTRLTTRPGDQIEADTAKIRHSRVESWTDNVDIFHKDFLFVPICDHGHWFLAIICFPGLNGSVGADGRPDQLPQRPLSTKAEPKTGKVKRIPLNKPVSSVGKSYPKGRTTTTPISQLSKGKVNFVPVNLTTDDSNNYKDEAVSDDDRITASEKASPSSTESVDSAPSVEEPAKQPCILIFDSVAGRSRQGVVDNLCDYLQIEYGVKRPDEAATKAYDKVAVKGYHLTVPLQKNGNDCGVYVLKFAEFFIEDPSSVYRFPTKSFKDWFTAKSAARKREEIQQLLLDMMHELQPEKAKSVSRC